VPLSLAYGLSEDLDDEQVESYLGSDLYDMIFNEGMNASASEYVPSAVN
jgi:hypothetical protein